MSFNIRRARTEQQTVETARDLKVLIDWLRGQAGDLDAPFSEASIRAIINAAAEHPTTPFDRVQRYRDTHGTDRIIASAVGNTHGNVRVWMEFDREVHGLQQHSRTVTHMVPRALALASGEIGRHIPGRRAGPSERAARHANTVPDMGQFGRNVHVEDTEPLDIESLVSVKSIPGHSVAILNIGGMMVEATGRTAAQAIGRALQNAGRELAGEPTLDSYMGRVWDAQELKELLPEFRGFRDPIFHRLED